MHRGSFLYVPIQLSLFGRDSGASPIPGRVVVRVTKQFVTQRPILPSVKNFGVCQRRNKDSKILKFVQYYKSQKQNFNSCLHDLSITSAPLDTKLTRIEILEQFLPMD